MPPKKIKKEKKFKKPNDWRNWVWYALLGLMIASVVATSFTNPKSATVKNFSSFMTAVEQGNVTNVTIRSNENLIEWSDKNEETFKSFFVAYPEFISELRDKGVNINVNPSDSGWVWSVFIQALLPFILIALLWFFIFRQAQGANSQAMSFGKSKANPWKKDENGTNTKFKDVAGINEAVEEVNYLQKSRLFSKITDYYGTDLSGKTFAVWGLAFKPRTDDMREAPSLTMIPLLREAGAKVQAFDPVAMPNAREILGEDGITYHQTALEALDGADSVLIFTEWDEFRGVDLDEVKKRLKEPLIFDGRNIHNLDDLEKSGFTYIDIGRKL